LPRVQKEKEELVEKAKSDLKMSERKLEEEKANLERSDPESVASSLTVWIQEEGQEPKAIANAVLTDKRRLRRRKSR
jgi:hypothetical protein